MVEGDVVELRVVDDGGGAGVVGGVYQSQHLEIHTHQLTDNNILQFAIHWVLCCSNNIELKANLCSSWNPPLGLAQGRQRLVSGRELADGDQLQQVPE